MQEAGMARRGDGLYQRGTRVKTWRLQFIHQGQRHQIRLGKGIPRSVAADLASVKRAGILTGEAGIGDGPPITLREYSTRWLRDITGSVAPKTHAQYRQVLELYIL